MTRQHLRRALAFLFTLLVGLSMTITGTETAFAASSKTPAKPVISSCKASGSKVVVKWKKAKNAKYYRVFVQTGGDKWKYWKRVAKTAKNKKKFSDRMKYKLKASGSKYKVYKQQHPYKVAAKKVTKRSFTYKGKYDTLYTFVVKAVNGKKLSAASKVKKVRTPVDPSSQSDEGQGGDSGDQGGDSGDQGGQGGDPSVDPD